jgi:hypothetical protein
MAQAAPDWPELLQLMTARFERLGGYVLENLEALLEAGRRIVNCAEAALMVPDGDGSKLRFLASVNSRPGVAEIVKQLAVPTERSIAGCVFTTGQLIAVANPDDFYAVVDQKTGLTTTVYLATPVMDQGDILGVATFVNRPEGQPQTPFSEQEIEASTRLAVLAAAGLRYHSRMAVQQRLLAAQLEQASQRFASGEASAAAYYYADAGPAFGDLPLARAVVALEQLSTDNQDLAADLLGVLATHARTA